MSKIGVSCISQHYFRLFWRSKLSACSPLESRPICGISYRDDAALRSVEGLSSAEGQLVAVRGDGSVLLQSTRQQLSLLPTRTG